MVTWGIYRISRNPAFLGFDLIYLGCAMAFPNLANIAIACCAITLFHCQILGEEKHCSQSFGEEYDTYKSTTRRYLGVSLGERTLNGTRSTIASDVAGN